MNNTRFRKLSRDVWNLFACKIPSRRLRRFYARRLLGGFDHGAFIGLGVQLLNPWDVHLQSDVVINSECIIDARGGGIHVGESTDIGLQTNIWTLEHSPNDEKHGTMGAPVIIEDHVWIATRDQRRQIIHGRGPKFSAKNRYQFSPMTPATSSSFIPTFRKPSSMLPKSRLS